LYIENYIMIIITTNIENKSKVKKRRGNESIFEYLVKEKKVARYKGNTREDIKVTLRIIANVKRR